MAKGLSFDVVIARLGRAVGLIGLVAFGAKWMVTGDSEPGLTVAFGGMYAGGQGLEALAHLRRPAEE
jgi:hypothetical protein